MNRFVVLSHQRAGSHFLMNLLNSHPQVSCRSDFKTAESDRIGAEATFQLGFQPQADAAAVGFLLKIKQKLHGVLPDDVRIILLERKNMLAMFLSRKLSDRMGCYETESGSLAEAQKVRLNAEPIHLELDQAIKFFERYARMTGAARELIAGRGPLELSYESLVHDPIAEMGRVWEYLGVEPHQASTTDGRGSSKLDQRPLHLAISNYAELIADLRQTKWADLIDPPANA